MEVAPQFDERSAQYHDQHLAARNLVPRTRREYLKRPGAIPLTNDCRLKSPARVEKRHLKAFLAELVS